jgi:rhamnose utilization protein RhaD (predicted bifunctional aldolase and dehydrogenase)/NAD(P)-dependent dehydrogenase (short-subunit alcohol dehydrogenase family)
MSANPTVSTDPTPAISPAPAATGLAPEALMASLINLSRHYGSDVEFCLAGGGNTSVKIGPSLFVKASGFPLATATADSFVEMSRSALDAALGAPTAPDPVEREERIKQATLKARVHPEKNQRPSVECMLHNLLPRQFVVHSHSTVVNFVTCARDGRLLAQELFGDDVLWIPYVDPGLILAQTLRDAIRDYAKSTGRDCPPIIFMQNHGLIVIGDSEAEIHKQTRHVIDIIRSRLALGGDTAPFGPATRLDAPAARKIIDIVAPALRGLLSTDPALRIVRFDDSADVLELVCGSRGPGIAAAGPLTPDLIVYCTSFPLWYEPPAEADAKTIVEQLRSAIAAHRQAHRFPPRVVLVKGVGMFTSGEDFAAADTTRLVFIDAIKILAGSARLGGINYLTPAQFVFIEDWEVEAYRRQVHAGAAARGRAAGKVALVTGAAQGFGLEIATDLAAHGAHVALADLNTEGCRKAAAEIAATAGPGKTAALAVNVTDPASIDGAVHELVRTFGGLDLLVSNAGVLKAGSVKTQSERDFDMVTAVNYRGYFLCVQKASPIMAVQRLAREDYFSDIIQINSKSGLQGSNRNGAYAGSKFGGIGLTQSFALELIEDGIKVNSICPGNFFDGPLWSDPNNGLFVQYLRTGKVPGAKTIEDVKKFYEAKVPMGRGCRTADVMKAIYYLMEQLYETGQAVPVTGGQVMLS